MLLPRSVLYGSALYHLSLLGPAPTAIAIALEEAWPGDAAAGERLAAGSFRFAGEMQAGPLPPWTAPVRPEFLASLHSFAWLADLAALDERGRATARRWTVDWLERCDGWDAIAWRADVMGARLTAWVAHWRMLVGRHGESDLGRVLLASMARQSRHLARVATHESPGVKRLAALAGLVVVCAALGNPARLERALRRLARELAVQLLPDGGHVERSPRAQLDALMTLVDARAALRAVQAEVPPALQSAIDRAAPMLRFFRHGDGGLALFNGADEMASGIIDLVLARSEAKGRAPFSAPHLGFQRLQAGHSLVLLDAGPPPPAGLDDNAHAGTLSFEMSHGRERLIVNCGAYHGRSAVWESVARATAAHSTLVVADTNSAEIRRDGRLGRRATQVSCERVEKDGAQWIAASHDGYAPIFGLIHARQIFLSADGEDLRGEDRISGKAGQGFAIRFHLHPQVQASLAQDGATALLRLPSGLGWRLRAQGAVMSLAESIYLSGGAPRKSQQVLLDGHVVTAGTTVKWGLRREGKALS